jgi:hypothetical protein
MSGTRWRCPARGPPLDGLDTGANAFRADCDAFAPQGRPTIPSPDMLLGQRSDPASPAVNQAPTLNQQNQGDLVVIHITLNNARRKGQPGRFTCGITPNVGKWSAPAANEVAP